jgi:phage portal protein BeeE
MSSPNEDDVFMKLAEEDGKILEELENVHQDYEKTLEIMERRFSLFREYAAQSTDPVVTEIILTQAQLNKLEMGLLNARHELQTDIAKLTGRIDDLESKHRTCQ